MFLIDKPFVSDFLINTIRQHGFEIISTKEARELICDNSLCWISEDEAITKLKSDPESVLYLNSENAIAWIVKNIGQSKLLNQIQQFKDKVRFRELMKSYFPDFVFRTMNLRDIQNYSPDEIDFPFVIKPSVGFFSLGVHIIHNNEEWKIAKEELNLHPLISDYPEDVINTSAFIIEEFIDGEEYAIDCYFNDIGEAVILNILLHKFSSGTDTSDRVYSTSKDIFNKYRDNIQIFLTLIGTVTKLRNFPLHIEIRVDEMGRITPVEVNPVRFGGWCTTGDLAWYAWGFNSYYLYITNRKPDWENILSTMKDKIYSLVVLNNNSGIAPSEIEGFNYDLLVKEFENPLVIRKLDIDKYPVFGFIFTETSLDKEDELDRILVSDLRKYIVQNISQI